ncbi:MAG TPA: mechanosensitive ion channel family protein [Tepidisphaeraceae bacterium]|jgi:small conductance mechanosensitive channel|nr:mechanosensitive ion channel family protein [Tepidisphaeraceae bacterium]
MLSRLRKVCGMIAVILAMASSAALAQSPFLDVAAHESSANSQTNPTSEPAATSYIQLIAHAHTGGVDLDWQCELPGIATYHLERAVHGTAFWDESKTFPANVNDFTDQTVKQGVTYDYRLTALDSAGKVLEISRTVSPSQVTLINAFRGDVVTLKDMMDFQFWQQSVNTLVLGTLAFVPKLLAALILFGIFWLIYRMIRRIVLGSMARAHVDSSIRDMLGSLIKWSIMGFGLVIACNQVGIEIAALLTGVSIIGLAIGFAAQETLANFIAGVVIFWDKPFKVGDWIIIDGMFGRVLRVSFRSTRMLNLNGETIVLPNTYMLANRVANHSTHPVVRVEIPIGIAYKESIDKARTALLATVDGDQRICKDPAPSVVVSQCADSSVNLLLRIWTRDEAIEKDVLHDYLEKAKKALDAANIEIPFPHVQLLLDNHSAISTMAADSLQGVR